MKLYLQCLKCGEVWETHFQAENDAIDYYIPHCEVCSLGIFEGKIVEDFKEYYKEGENEI